MRYKGKTFCELRESAAHLDTILGLLASYGAVLSLVMSSLGLAVGVVSRLVVLDVLSVSNLTGLETFLVIGVVVTALVGASAKRVDRRRLNMTQCSN